MIERCMTVMHFVRTNRHASVMDDDIPSVHRLTMDNDNVASNAAAETARDCVDVCTMANASEEADGLANLMQIALPCWPSGHRQGMAWRWPKDRLLRHDSENATL